jgi:sulfide dehydrogenase [flavocytochrome c] flavoprotein chain
MAALHRRNFLKFAAATASVGVLGVSARLSLAKGQAQVVVIGGGYGGATAARYLKLWGGKPIHVSLIERNQQFISPVQPGTGREQDPGQPHAEL